MRPTPGGGFWGTLLARSGQAGWLVLAWPCSPGAQTSGRALPWGSVPQPPPASPARTCGQEQGGQLFTALPTRWCEAVQVAHVFLLDTDLGILLGMALGNQGLEVWPLTPSEECAITGFLRDKLQYRNRLQYMVTMWAPAVSFFPSPLARGAYGSGHGGSPLGPVSALSQHDPFLCLSAAPTPPLPIPGLHAVSTPPTPPPTRSDL